jgi:hypothetical protein
MVEDTAGIGVRHVYLQAGLSRGLRSPEYDFIRAHRLASAMRC